MPAVGFTKAGSGSEDVLSFEEAPAWYEENTEIPAEAIRLVAAQEEPRRLGTNLSPSSLDIETNCHRQLLIKKFLPYVINGIEGWQAMEGTIWHDALEACTHTMERDDWHREALLPDLFRDPKLGRPWEELLDEGLVRLWQYTPDHAAWEVQIFPDIWVNGRADKLHKTWQRIEDFKTKAWPITGRKKNGEMSKPRHYPPGQSDIIQLNTYRRMIEVLTGETMDSLVIRRMYRGSRIPSEAWKKYELDIISDTELEAIIRPGVERFTKWAVEMKAIKEDSESRGEDPVPLLLAYLQRVPLYGKDLGMFRTTKCTKYCEQMPICFDLAGLVRFNTAADECRVIRIGDTA